MYLTQSLHRNVTQRPQQLAMVDSGKCWTYSELQARVEKFAGALQSLGVSDGARVAMMAMNSARYLEYTFAVPWAGGALNPVNIRWSATEIAYSLDDSETKILLVDDAFIDYLPEVREKSSHLEHVIYVGETPNVPNVLYYETLVTQAQAVADNGRCDDDLAGVFYTGGTTGFPKGVMLSHKNLITSSISFIGMNIMPSENLRYLHCAPMFHLADFAMTLVASILGGTHVFVPGFEPARVVDAIESEKVSAVLLVPTMVQILLDSGALQGRDVSSLTRIIYGASAMPLGTLNQALEAMPNVEFSQAYGMTELSPLACVNGPENHTDEGRKNGRIKSAGIAGPLQDVKIVSDDNNEVPRGVVGEIIVRGPNVMMGYWGKPEATSEAIVDGWMHTGDGGYMDDHGYVYVVDRVKDMIISGGENIYSAEVENAVTQHPDVAQCAAIGIPDSDWGEAVHVVIVAVEGKTPLIKDIRAFSKTLIAGYKCPRTLELVSALPLSGAGKVLKTELRKPYWQDKEKNIG